MSVFILSGATRIEADESLAPIRNAAGILRRDMEALLTEAAEENVIRVFQDASLPPESFRAEVTAHEIILRCGDDLGAVYALLSVSERGLNVAPLGWWNDQRPPRRPYAEIPCGSYASPEYAVRFRCWFINDEVLLDGWKDSVADKFAVWRRVFETILRCGGNMVIAGTDREYDGRALNAMALDMGLWLTQHHTELLGARMFGRAYPDLTPSYALYPEKFEALWQEAIDLYAGRRVLWAVGFRGQGDKAFWNDDSAVSTDEARGAFIAKVMRHQMELVRKKDPCARFATNLYGEMMALYRMGHLPIPDGVIKVWSDNGYGAMVSRRQNNDNPRVAAMPGAEEQGPHGIYYHAGFYDLQAANHITMLQIPPRRVADELRRTLDNCANTLWNINVGSIKPHIFILDLVRQMWTEGACDCAALAREYAAEYYGDEAVAPLLNDYASCAIPYGPNEDDRAGDQFYHFPLRQLAHALLRGETGQGVSALRWVAGDASFTDQAKRLSALAARGMASWERYAHRCEQAAWSLSPNGAQLMRDTLLLQATLHQTGSEALYCFCQACVHAVTGNDFHAFLWTDQAVRAQRKGLTAMRAAAHGSFVNIYRNDCFSNVALSVQVLESVRGYLRVRGDGCNLYRWEKQYLTPPEENRVVLQTHRTAQLTDEMLGLRLMDAVTPETAF